MGLSSFLKRGNEPPEASAFDSIPPEVRQLIANDMLAIIECIKAWRAAVQSPEHAKAMLEESKAIGRKLGSKLVTMAMTGKADGLFDRPDWHKELGLPVAVIEIIEAVKSAMEPTVTPGEPTIAPGIGDD